jgi:uncharacterized protein (TIRG00374 family)
MWNRRARSSVLLVISAVSLYLLLPSVLAVFGSWRSLSHLDWVFAALALASEAASFALVWQLNRIALHTRMWFPVATAQLIGNAVGKVVPGGAATATAFSVGVLRNAGVDPGEAGAGLVASTALQFATRLALPVFALPAIIGGAPISRNLSAAAYLGLGVVVLMTGAGIAAFTVDGPLNAAGRAIEWLLNVTIRRRHPVTGLPEALIAGRDYIANTVGVHWRGAVVAAVGSAAFDYLALLCALRAVGAVPRPALVLLAYAAAQLLALVPITPGGVGFVEAGLVGTLTLAGVPAQDALAATLLYRLVSYWLPLPAGAVAYLLFRRRYGGRAAESTQPVGGSADAATTAEARQSTQTR